MRRSMGMALGAGLIAVLAACGPDPAASSAPNQRSSPAPSPAVATAPSPAPVTTTPSPAPTSEQHAVEVLATLAVKGRAPMTGYDRDAFGQAWADVDRNGCDTRNDMLRRDLVQLVLDPATGGCVVLSGDLAPDPYTASRIHFERGGASEIDIDHVVALGNSWASGSAYWEVRKRIAFANDPMNLLPVDASANRQKGDGDAATWLPANTEYRCAYVARQVAVKSKYGLSVTAAERDAIARVLGACLGQDLPTGDAPVLAPAGLGVVPPRSTAAPATAAPAGAPSSATDPQFPYCKDATAAGYGPYVAGTDPEYSWYRDADHDGVVCE